MIRSQNKIGSSSIEKSFYSLRLEIFAAKAGNLIVRNHISKYFWLVKAYIFLDEVLRFLALAIRIN